MAHACSRVHTSNVCSYMASATVEKLLSAVSEVISSSDHSDSWPIKCSSWLLLLLDVCWASHRGVDGRTNSSLRSRGRDARKAWLCLRVLCLCASQLAVRADKKGGGGRAADSGFIPQTPRLLLVCLSLCSCRSGS